jgi:hypothetical protein
MEKVDEERVNSTTGEVDHAILRRPRVGQYHRENPLVRDARQDRWWPISLAVGAVALAFYLWLAPAVSGDRDSSEFTLVLALGGIAHPTGYVLYGLLGHAFVVAAHALGATWAFASNAWSALGGAFAMAFLYALGSRLARGGRALPLLPVALLLLNPAWTQVTTLAEVYSWHLAWVLALAACAFAWGAGEGRGSPTAPAVWGLLCGLGLAHHATAVLVVIPMTVALWRARGFSLRELAWFGAALAAVPLASLALLRVHLFHPSPADWPALESSWASAWAHMTGAQYQGAFGRFAPEPMDRALIERCVFPFLFPGLLALAAGWLVTRRSRERTLLAGLLVAAVAQTAFAFGYGVEDPSSYFLPALALGLVGVVPVVAAAAASGRNALAGARAGVVALAIVAVALMPGWLHAARETRDTLVGLDRFVHEQWERIPVERGLVLWARDMYQRLREYQLLDGEKPGLEVWNPWLFTNPAVRRRFAAEHGFDPVGDLSISREDLMAPPGQAPGADGFLVAVIQRINVLTPLPVVLFEPEVPRVTVLGKRETPTR